MKLKRIPEDFKVEEITVLDIKKSPADYKVYLLEKKSIESFYLFSYLSKKNQIPISDLGFAGLKDKHAITKQYVTVPSKCEIKTSNEQNFKITFLGYSTKPLKLGDLQGNKFEVTVRDIAKGDMNGIAEKIKAISELGIPNYYDSQRFGSVIGKDFIVKSVMKKDYENAVKSFITSNRFESREAENEKSLILEKWPKFEGIKLYNNLLNKIIGKYLRSKNWLSTYKEIPSNFREIFVSAYQSYIWNECVKAVLHELLARKSVFEIKYNIGALSFFKKVSADRIGKLPQTFKLISHDAVFSEYESKIVEKVLSREKVSLADFDIKKETHSFFKSQDREMIIKPKNLRMSEVKEDEFGKNRFKLTFFFELPKGSYATIVTKRIFNQ